MRKLTPVDLKPWVLPLVVLALVLPVVVATLLGGSVAGMIAGALVAASVIVIAARARYDEEIEVASTGDRRYHLLVVALSPVEEPGAVEAIARAARQGSAARGSPASSPPAVLVLAPAVNRRLSRWTSDVGGARLAAQERLAVSLASLATAGLDARGAVGDSDPVQAVEDTLRSFPAQEAVFVTPDEGSAAIVAEVRRRLDRPVRHLPAAGGVSLPAGS